MRKKGFTLIELLAVIIVLAIIALIATPIIFNVIENAKLKSLKNSCYGVIDAVRTQYAENLLKTTDGKVNLSGEVVNLSLSGEHPIAGTWAIDNTADANDKGIKIQGVKFASMIDYTCTNYINGKIQSQVTCTKDDNEPDEFQPIINANSNTVTVNKGEDIKIKNYFNVQFGRTGGNVTCEVENINLLEVGDHTIKCTAAGTNGKVSDATIKITVKDGYTPTADKSGANAPKLFKNMIPIKYNGTNWVVANENEKWYNYDAKEWANAVVLNSDITKNIGEIVTEEEISLWYVWIPRYKYTIFNGNNERVPEQVIDITFESNTARTGTVACQDDFTQADKSEVCTDTTNGSIKNGVSTYTHPAFKFGDTELTGFWMGKFEVSGNINSITMKPGVKSLEKITISKFFTTIQNISTTYGIDDADSHMIKNMEWGAVAYLKQSKYGLGINDIAINDNPYYNITGGGSKNLYKINVSQSTTGNIYGVYDMSGGAAEYVMGNMKKSNNSFYVSKSGFEIAPDSKYYDSYQYGKSQTEYTRGKLGDATKEILSSDYSYGWYYDTITLPYFQTNIEYSWFTRGFEYDRRFYAGIFGSSRENGGGYSYITTRAVLSAQ